MICNNNEKVGGGGDVEKKVRKTNKKTPFICVGGVFHMTALSINTAYSKTMEEVYETDFLHLFDSLILLVCHNCLFIPDRRCL